MYPYDIDKVEKRDKGEPNGFTFAQSVVEKSKLKPCRIASYLDRSPESELYKSVRI